MERTIYISAKEDLRRKIKKQLTPRMQKQAQIIFTDDVHDADFFIIEKQEDNRLENEQFRAYVIAKESGARFRFVKDNSLEKEKEKQAATTQTRKNFDMEIE